MENISKLSDDTYHSLGCIMSIVAHEHNEITLTSFDITNKILPAIRFGNFFICYNDNGHPVSFFIWKKIQSDSIESLKRSYLNWHKLLGWNEGGDYLITHFFSHPQSRISSINLLINNEFQSGDVVVYFNNKGRLIRRVV